MARKWIDYENTDMESLAIENLYLNISVPRKVGNRIFYRAGILNERDSLNPAWVGQVADATRQEVKIQ